MPEEEVDVQRSLVRLVEDDRVVVPQHRIALHFGEEHAVGQKLDHRRRSRLVVETNLAAHLASPRDAQLLRHSDLGSRGHAVVAVRSGEEALALMQGSGFDVCVCDLRMPGMDGVELLRRLRQTPEGARMRVIVSTGEGPRSPLRAQAVALGDVTVIEKPYDVGVLRRAVEHTAALP